MSEPQRLRELAREREVFLATVGLVQDVKILVREPRTAKAIRAVREPDALHQVVAARATFAGDAMAASEARDAAAAMGAIGAVRTSRAVVAAGDALRVAAEGAEQALLTAVAFD